MFVDAAVELEKIVNSWGLTLSVAKTKLLVTGSASDVERLPIKLQGGEIECVSEFKYLRSMESGGGVMVEVGERITQASGALCEPIFRNCNLSLRTKRHVTKLLYWSSAIRIRDLDHQGN